MDRGPNRRDICVNLGIRRPNQPTPVNAPFASRLNPGRFGRRVTEQQRSTEACRIRFV